MLFCFIIQDEPPDEWFRIMHYPLSFWLLVAQLVKQALRYKIPQSRLAWSGVYPSSWGTGYFGSPNIGKACGQSKPSTPADNSKTCLYALAMRYACMVETGNLAT